MILLIDITNLKLKKSKDSIPLKCEKCEKIFYSQKKQIQRVIKHNGNRLKYCSKTCHSNAMMTSIKTQCTQCHNPIFIYPFELKKSKNHFCSLTCFAIYNNAHKTTGYRRSKLEIWIESQLTLKYPDLQIDYNKINTINAELDVYIPSLKLAFELNGIFHYEPIYGIDKLKTIQNNDNRKFQACLERGIELCIIDTYNIKYLKKERDKKFLNIITNIIDVARSKNIVST